MLKQAWWKTIVQDRDDMVGLDTSILMHPKVWEASGHITSFSDPLVECKNCHLRCRADELKEQNCPSCGGELTEPRMFNLMFKTFMGPVEDQAAVVYLRPETAQGMFVNFQNVMTTTRKRLPFGIAQQGKAFAMRLPPATLSSAAANSSMMEFEFFVKPGTDEKWFDYWVDERLKWYNETGHQERASESRTHIPKNTWRITPAPAPISYTIPHGLGRARRHCQPRRLRPQTARDRQRQEHGLL